METLILRFLENLPTIPLFAIILGTLYILSRGADLLVEEAVRLSILWRIPKVLIGATIVSLGTTLPEAAVSVLAAFRGNSDLALGNAVGSIICDTGLIIGAASLISPLTLDRQVVNRQGWLQLGAGVLLALVSLPYAALLRGAPLEGRIPQSMGILFVILLILYLFVSIRWSRTTMEGLTDEKKEDSKVTSMPILLLKLAAGSALIILSSRVLIPSVEITALRIGIPQGIIAATLVALGTSLPELATAITAARKGHGELAVGNVIGADILNVLFVVGVSASVTKGGLKVPPTFYFLQLPVMLLILLTFKGITHFEKRAIKPSRGIFLLFFYLGYILVSYLV